MAPRMLRRMTLLRVALGLILSSKPIGASVLRGGATMLGIEEKRKRARLV